MTSPITTARKALAQALTESGLNAHPTAPLRPAPPCAHIAATSVEQGADDPYGYRTLRARIRLISRPGDPETVQDTLDDLTTTAIQAIDTHCPQWAVESTSEPYVLVLTEAQTLPAQDITATTTIQL